MNVTYQRELNEAYMILEGEEECEEYALRILQENRLKGVMSLGIREVDGKRDYWFAISDGKPLDRILEKRSLEYEEICHMIRSISKILGQMEEYLLNPEHLLLDPSFLYLGNRTLPRGQGHSYHETDFSKVMVCCHPAWSRDFYEQMRILMQFFINKMDHRDAHGVEAAYQMFHVTEKEYFRMDELLQIIDTAQNTADEETEVAEKNPDTNLKMEQHRRSTESKKTGRGAKVKEASDSSMKKEQPLKKTSVKTGDRTVIKRFPTVLAMILQIAGALLLGLAAWIRYRMGWIDTTVIGAAIICLAVGLLIRRTAGKDVEEHITDTYVSHSTNEYREARIYGEGGTELLTGSFPGRSTPILVSENLTEQENIPLGTMPFTLGSGEGVNGRLDWSTISREHAVVECQGGQYSLKDCHSTNGTFLNGRKLEAEQWYPLHFGDEIVLANRGFIFRAGV